MLIFFNSMSTEDSIYEESRKIWNDAAKLIEGEGTLGFMDCTSKEGQKLCKLVKGIAPESVPFLVKYYR